MPRNEDSCVGPDAAKRWKALAKRMHPILLSKFRIAGVMRNGGCASAGVRLCLGKERVMATIPDKYRDLLQQKKAFAILATVMPDGSPQVTPVWFDHTNGLIRVNTARGRVKARTLQAGAAVAMAIVIPTIPTVTSRFAAGSGASRRMAPLSTSIRWPRNIWGRTNTPLVSPERCGCSARSN